MNSGIFSSLSVFSYCSVSENMTLWGNWGVTLYNWGKPWWITLCYRGTDFRHMSSLFLLNFLSFLVIYPEGVVARHPEKSSHSGEDPSPTGRPWCLPRWRLPWRGDMWASTLSGNWPKRIRWFLVQMILREAISCPGNKEESGVEDGGPPS